MSSMPGTNALLDAIFVLCLCTMAGGALLAVFSARLIRSVCGLAICCVGLAGLYYFLHSPFLALMEILIYVGAVCVTIVFAVMLAEPEEPASQESQRASFVWGGSALAVAVTVFCGIAWLGTQRTWDSTGSLVNDGSIASIGVALLTSYSLAFELISLALLVAVIGALALARTGRSLPHPGNPAALPSDRLPVLIPDTEAARPGLAGKTSADLIEVPRMMPTASFEQTAAGPAHLGAKTSLETSRAS